MARKYPTSTKRKENAVKVEIEITGLEYATMKYESERERVCDMPSPTLGSIRNRILAAIEKLPFEQKESGG
jgi:hypothetical protein